MPNPYFIKRSNSTAPEMEFYALYTDKEHLEEDTIGIHIHINAARAMGFQLKPSEYDKYITFLQSDYKSLLRDYEKALFEANKSIRRQIWEKFCGWLQNLWHWKD